MGARGYLYETSAGAWMALPFVALTLIFGELAPPTPFNLSHADPLVQSLRAAGGPYAIPAVALGVIAFWMIRASPKKIPWAKAFFLTGMGAIAAFAGIIALRLIAGPKLPSFIPPEESARPGLFLGLSAGLAEEAIFRLLVLPMIFGFFSRKLEDGVSTFLAVLLTGLLFALSHELPPAHHPLRWDLFATRTLVPGIGMSVLYFFPGPAFIISFHCTAHLAIPYLFE
ncbi:MAG: CPBP family glutamic-type intramembrane protease [Bdellovibrionota bacterium]